MRIEQPGGLGRREPTTWVHVERFPFSAVAPPTVTRVERVLYLPWPWWKINQGREGACVGCGWTWACSIMNFLPPASRRYYSWRDLWNEAKRIDEWPDTNPGDSNGTSVRAGGDVLRTKGHWRKVGSKVYPVSLDEGILGDVWARNVDEMRTSIASGVPCVIGVNWYSAADHPETRTNAAGNEEDWILTGDSWGSIRGGHCVCVYGASDERQAVRFVNSWGTSYRPAWLPYTAMQRLINEAGEVAIITDRPTP